jgi:phosphoenolpyruvate-protein phosphotransferase
MSQNACMALEFTFLCSLPNGFHARPASHVATLAGKFTSDCALTNLRNGRVADMKSVLSLIAANISLHDECRVRVNGADEQAAHKMLQQFIENDLPACDVPLPELAQESQNGMLPRSLRSLGLENYCGFPVSRGIGYGKVVIIGGVVLPPELSAEKAADPKQELQRAKRAMDGVRARIGKKLAGQVSAAETGILQAHLAILGDVSLADKVLEKINEGRSAGQAILEATEFFSSLLRESESHYIRERAVDLHEIGCEALKEIYGLQFQPAVELTEPSVVIAENLTPQQLLELDRKGIRALVLESAGTTSHTVILARSLAIPTLIGVKNLPQLLSPGQEVVVDANRGVVIPKCTPPVRRYYERELGTLQRRQAVLARDAMAPAITVDGRRIEVAANLSSAEELAPAFANGADGIGLFRTEMLFAGRDHPPSEDEQFEVYAQAARAARGRPVILRTFDIGGDKPVAYFKLPAEDNPFLGYRGVRIYQEHRDLVCAQLRAILRASALGRVHLMVPMVASREEVLWVKAQLAEAQRDLRSRQIAFDPAMPVGIMIEIPSVAFILDQLCEEVDFFSIGTNDLVQYFLAVDRGNPRVSRLSNVRNPAFLRFLKQIVDDVHKGGKYIGMCGEMAADSSHLPLLLALGLDEISVPSFEIPMLKERISRLTVSASQSLLSSALACEGVAEVESLLAAGAESGPDSPLLDRDLVVLGSKSESKEEAIREIINAFYIKARTNDPDRLEEAVWSREEVYSTGLGYGFAIPHCKTDAVVTGSIGVLKLSRPVEWGALDGQPVHTVILLAARESDANGRHMQIFSQLARKLMSEEFRSQLVQAEDPNAVLGYLMDELAIGV